MEIAVLGGAGGIGRALVRDLLEHSDVRVRIVDANKLAARKFADGLGDRVRVAVADAARPRTLLRALDGVQAAVSCIGPFYRFGVTVARAILDAGISGVDICDDYAPVRGLLALDEVAKTRKVVYVTGVGWSPGLTNMLARRVCASFDRVRQVQVRWAAGSGDYRGPAALKHLLFTSTGDVPTFRAGTVVRVEAWSEPELVEFPPPIGTCEVAHCGHPEPLTLPEHLKAQEVTVKGGLVPRWNNRAVRWAVRLGLTKDDRSIEKTARLINRFGKVFLLGGGRHVGRSGALVEVVGTRQGAWRRVRASVVDRLARLTALPAAVAVLAVARGQVKEPGLYPPEACLDPGAFFSELAIRGIVVEEEESSAGE